MNDKFLSFLGIIRRSGKMSTGHDAAVNSIVKNKAKLCVISREGSDRLRREMEHACNYENKNIPFMVVDYTVFEIAQAIGIKAAVLTVDDEGCAKALKEKYSVN